MPDTSDRLRRLSRAFTLVDRVSELSGRAASWLVMPLILGVTYEVFARDALNAPTVWAYDLAYMLYASIFMLGAAYALRRGAHVRADFLYNGFTARERRRIPPHARPTPTAPPGMSPPIAFTLVVITLVFGYIGLGPMVFDLIALQTIGLAKEEVLAAVPLQVNGDRPTLRACPTACA